LLLRDLEVQEKDPEDKDQDLGVKEVPEAQEVQEKDLVAREVQEVQEVPAVQEQDLVAQEDQEVGVVVQEDQGHQMRRWMNVHVLKYLDFQAMGQEDQAKDQEDQAKDQEDLDKDQEDQAKDQDKDLESQVKDLDHQEIQQPLDQRTCM